MGLSFIMTFMIITANQNNISAVERETPPVIYNISDAVRPGKTFRVNGSGFYKQAHLKVYLDRSDGNKKEELSGKESKIEIIQNDLKGNFLVALLPPVLEPGIYNICVKTKAGLSNTKKLNVARALFLSEREAYEGLTLQLTGRNLDAREFGAPQKDATMVRLNDGSNHLFPADIKEYNPYCVSFVIPKVPIRDYFIEVSNDKGINWGRLENGQTLTILDKPAGNVQVYDPLGLGVSWASHFNWSNIVSVPASDGHQDVTEIIQAFIDEIGSDFRGGVIYFPKGKYKLSQLLLPKNVVLLGQSPEESIFNYFGDAKDFIACKDAAIKEGHVGIANLTIEVPDEVKTRPDIFINLGQSVIWEGVENINIRTASEMFVFNVKINYDFTETKKDRRGLPLCSIGKERLYVANCTFEGFHLESHNYVSEYVTVKDNSFEFAQGVFIYTGDYLFLERNRIIGHTEINREKHGFMFRANAYVYKNTVSNTGSEEDPLNENWNDGEALCNETPGGSHNFGYIASAAANTLVAGKTAGPFAIPGTNIYNHWVVMIVHGKGLGQYRKIRSMDTRTRSIQFEKPWDVIPDSTSRFTLMSANENTTYYKNTVNNNPKGLWLFGNSIDCVVAENVSINSDGIFVFSCRYVNSENAIPMYYFVPNYYNRITGNVILGVSRKSHRAGIGINTTRETNGGSYFGVEAYGNEIRGNYIKGEPSETALSGVTEAPAISGVFLYATIHSSLYDGKNIAGDITNTIIEDNHLCNLKSGISLSRCIYGQVVRNNKFDTTVDRLLENSTGSQNTTVISNE